ncbi:MAG: hypothetical protein Q8L88_10870 [Bacteroidota bacterium]|nr:hypothetical protein [Bacteroidota bacterium]
MEEKILQAILEEIKGLRSDTNARFISLENRIGNVEDGITISNQRLGSLEAKSDESNQRLGSLENKSDESNQRLGSLENKSDESNQRLGSLEAKSDESNHRLDSLENKVDESNKRLGSLENKFEGLKSSVEVLQIGVNQVRYELIGIKDILGTKVIWQNETITLEVKDGTKIYGTIHKGEK